MRLKKAFTLAEAILTMTILGIIAATMVTTLRPAQYKQQGFDVLKKKIYSELDGVIQTYIVECAQNLNATQMFNSCNRALATHTFGTQDGTLINSRYMRGTFGAANSAVSGCTTRSGEPTLKLRNGACLSFSAGNIRVDINGTEGPNAGGEDQMRITVGADGISNDLDTAITTSF